MWLGPELEPLLAVAIAVLDKDATLVEANAGFLSLINLWMPRPIGTNVARFFIQPNFATLVGKQVGMGKQVGAAKQVGVGKQVGADGLIHQGLLTVGDYQNRSRTLRARIWRIGDRLRFLAEHDVEELERVNDTVLALNRDYASAQFALAQVNLKLQQREAQIVESSLTDPLTGVGNRRRLEQALAAEVSHAELTGGKLCASMADLDYFKRVNDTYGHEAGDKVLATFGDQLRRLTRATDIVTRFGGEEFVILMPNTELRNAVTISERVREAFAAHQVEPLPEPTTASFGVAQLTAGERGDALLRRADAALYVAKHSGRNRVSIGRAA